MDTHITEIEQSQGPRIDRARVALPGEGLTTGPDTQIEAAQSSLTADPAMRLSEAAVASNPVCKRRRPWLLGTVAMLAFGGGAVGFLLSPYNTVYPIDTARLQQHGAKIAQDAQRRVADLVAPSAWVAHAPPPAATAPPVRMTETASNTDAQLQEILALRDPGRASSASGSSAVAMEVGQMVTSAITPPTGPAHPSVSAPPPTVGNGVAANSAPAALSAAVAAPPVLVPPSAPSAVITPPSTGASLPAPEASRTPPPLVVYETGAAPAPAPQTAQAAVPPIRAEPPQAAKTPPQSPIPQVASPPPAGQRQAIAAVPVNDPPPPAPPALFPASPLEANSQPSASLASGVPSEPSRRVLVSMDPVVRATELRAAPMTPIEQVEVLETVTKLGALVRDMRAENAAIKAKLEAVSQRVDGAVGDFSRRLALAEAHGALDAAMGAPASSGAPDATAISVPPSDRIASGSGKGRTGGPGVQTLPLPGTAPATGAVSPPRYRVTAASPGLAMLALLDHAGGEVSQLQIQLGDQVPGYGRVTSIQQKGSAWVVQTDKGAVQ